MDDNTLNCTQLYLLFIKRFSTFLGFDTCVRNCSNECNCSYSCKFVREYFEDSRELSNEEMKQMSSEWTERRRNSLIEKERRKEEEAEAQKEMWKRVQEMMANDED